MRHVTVVGCILGALAMLPAAPQGASAQIIKRIGKTVSNAAQDESLRQIDRLVRDKVRCVFDDLECIRQANASGKGAVLTDDDGNILVDKDGQPVSDPDQGAQLAAQGVQTARPGEGAWANYDFQPGDDVLMYEDFTADRVGDFPSRFDLIAGNWEIVEWEGGRYLRATSGGILAIPLPKTLPERFTMEFSVNFAHGNAYVRLLPGRAYYGPHRDYHGSVVSVEHSRAGIRPSDNRTGPQSLSPIDYHLHIDQFARIRVMADSNHMKMYLNQDRIANVPNAVFPRSDTLFLAVSWGEQARPILIGPIRIAGGGPELYQRLARDGRAATHGILFATNSARIRPESTPTLEEIGTMLKQHPDLRLSIEGHTDSDGEADYNQTLSEERAAAVKDYLVQTDGIAADRLETMGFGESKPVADNSTSEGKQQNRRVELVRLDQGSGG
jgi:OmpA-OmpF porin, OOP family